MSKSTPRPWHYGVTEQGYFGEGLIGPQGETVFANTGRGMSDASEANAKLIVRAVNNYDALLAALISARAFIPKNQQALRDRINAAIAAAEASE